MRLVTMMANIIINILEFRSQKVTVTGDGENKRDWKLSQGFIWGQPAWDIHSRTILLARYRNPDHNNLGTNENESAYVIKVWGQVCRFQQDCIQVLKGMSHYLC